MIRGLSSMSGAGRFRTQLSEAQMARHWGHQRNRRPLCIFLSTSTGEQLHSGHGSATNSGSSITVPGHRRATCPVGRNNRAGRIAHTYGGVERDTPASIGGLPHEGHQRHLECQRDDVQSHAGMGSAKQERARNGRVMSARGRTTAVRERLRERVQNEGRAPPYLWGPSYGNRCPVKRAFSQNLNQLGG